MAKKGKSQKVAPKEQSDADADQAAGEAGDKKGKKVIEHDSLRENTFYLGTKISIWSYL